MRIVRIFFLSLVVLVATFSAMAQPMQGIKWNKQGTGYFAVESGEIVYNDLNSIQKKTIVTKAQLTPTGTTKQLSIRNFFFSEDAKKLLIYTNSKKVWRYDTRGDYWVLDIATSTLKQLGKGKPESSLMFAKFSPNSLKVAYVSEYNIYSEDLSTGKIEQLSFGGSRKKINGTFDWAYEEEFFCRDGFRWSPDSKQIAYWQMDAKITREHLMINNTDSIYPFAVPVEYPVAGEAPSPFKIGVVALNNPTITKWMQIPTDPILQSYVPRMEWAANSTQLIVQHLNRKQNESEILLCDVVTTKTNPIYHESDQAWIDILALWDEKYSYGGWDWIENGNAFLWASEKDGWRHLYRISRDGKSQTLITNGKYDVMQISAIDEKNGYLYFEASPDNATQKYLYRTKLDGTGTAMRVTPANQPGTHSYTLSPNAIFAKHSFTNYYTPNISEWVKLNTHQPIDGDKVNKAIQVSDKSKINLEFFTITTSEGVTMDAWMSKPANFNPAKKYPVLFYVYTEPWGQNVKDEYGVGNDYLFRGDLAQEGYFYISIDNRGTPVPKGRAWRKSIYKNIGQVNIRDQALAAKEILKWPYIDSSRIAVWGWSGGGSATQNLLFQYPEIYKTGVAVAGVANQLTYDNLYQERYMGLPQEDKSGFIKGSPITYAKNLKGNLLLIHGTGDDNVHYSNMEMLVNELVKYGKQFQMMSYPNRTHSISEGPGTFNHLSQLYTDYIRKNCPGGAK
ncbi:MAG: DPP IV N-terminal domain-containing protein [Bacteroidetes bacterium]|nr:DPP IV N-terminal domain-containing protein [Bacteroidota bacterium]